MAVLQADIVDKNFTARMEANIDKIALGQANRTDVLDEFWESLQLGRPGQGRPRPGRHKVTKQ